MCRIGIWVFTIPDALRPTLEKDHRLLRVLIDTVSQTMKRIIADRKRATPGVICVLHPYGKDLRLNPHVQVLATESRADLPNSEDSYCLYFQIGPKSSMTRYE